jgi:hypothetical protein
MTRTMPNELQPPRGDATLALLWERIRQQGDMPGFTKRHQRHPGAMRGEDEREFS